MFFDLVDISEVRHYLGEKFLFFFGFSLVWDNLNSLIDLFDKGSHVLDLGCCHSEQELGEFVNPFLDDAFQVLDERL